MPDWIINKDPEKLTEAQFEALMKMSGTVQEMMPEQLSVIVQMIGYDEWLLTLTKGQASMQISDAMAYRVAQRTEKDRLKRESKACERTITCMVCHSRFKTSIKEYKKQCPKCKTVFFEVS